MESLRLYDQLASLCFLIFLYGDVVVEKEGIVIGGSLSSVDCTKGGIVFSSFLLGA